jgi:hypothetical protein
MEKFNYMFSGATGAVLDDPEPELDLRTVTFYSSKAFPPDSPNKRRQQEAGSR